MQTMFCCYYFKRSFSFQVFFDGLQLCLCTILRVPVSLLKCRSSFLLVQCRPFSHVASIDSNSASCFVLAHPSFGACPRSSQSRLCAYFPSGHSYAPSLIDSVSLFSLSLKKGAYQGGRGFESQAFSLRKQRIWTALAAAPLRIWSPQHQRVMPSSSMRSCRMRPTQTRSWSVVSSGVG